MRPGMQSVTLVSFVVLFAACDTGPLDVGTATKEQPLFASKPVGPVTINTVIDFTEFPFEGTFTVTAGCDKTYPTCRDRFANVVNFGGFPHMPGNDFALSYPNQGSGNDGGKLGG